MADETNRPTCATCSYHEQEKGECRRDAPTINGWPAVASTDWCGDHPIAVAARKVIEATPMARLMQRMTESQDDALNRLGK